ncbi:MAG: hypothetical protein AAGI15_09700 [Pseudomonadota bacterium]
MKLPLLCCAVLALSACDRPAPAQDTPPYVLTLAMHDLMARVIDPAADVIWASAGSVITEAGEASLAPTTDEGWQQVGHAAATLIESANLLLLPGRAEDQEDWAEFALGLASIAGRALEATESQDEDALFAAGADLYQVCLACHQQYDREIADATGP